MLEAYRIYFYGVFSASMKKCKNAANLQNGSYDELSIFA